MIKKIALISIIGIIIILLSVEGGVLYLNRVIYHSGSIDASQPAGLNELLNQNKLLKKKLTSLSPNGVYIIVDTARNLLLLKNRDETLLQAIVSSGSGNVLRDPNGDRQWIFDTPRGEFSVKKKLVGPTWTKPDWAFVEDGEDIPKNWKDRIEEGVLGDYALAFGNGYFIHGTLYTRLLGRNVTHGCIRVADKDLESIYKKSPVGTRIYIF